MYEIEFFISVPPLLKKTDLIKTFAKNTKIPDAV